MQAGNNEPTILTKTEVSIGRLEQLGDDLVSHLSQIAASWQDFCNFLTGETKVDTKRLRDFIAAYHELLRALMDSQGEQQSGEHTPSVVILPPVLDEHDD